MNPRWIKAFDLAGNLIITLIVPRPAKYDHDGAEFWARCWMRSHLKLNIDDDYTLCMK